MGFGAEVEMRMMMGEDHTETKDDENSPGGIVVETLVNIRTVASLTIENKRSKEYWAALEAEDPTPLRSTLKKGSTAGLGFFIQCWGEQTMFCSIIVAILLVVLKVFSDTIFMFVSFHRNGLALLVGWMATLQLPRPF